MKLYHNFDEIEHEVNALLPSVIYKYRNWDDKWHKNVVVNQELWFAHPKSLNDPYDVRPPYNFIFTQIEPELIKSHLREAGRALYPDLTQNQLEFDVDMKFNEIIKDPQGYFEKNRMAMILDSSKYNSYGVLSLCASFNNEAMWEHYGNNSSGFAIGFDSIQLAKALNTYFGIVEYSDKPIDYFVFGNNDDLFDHELFRKSTKWQSEQEIRFVTLGVGYYKERNAAFPRTSVKEIVFGLNTSSAAIDEITKIGNTVFPNVIFYKLSLNSDSFGYSRERL